MQNIVAAIFEVESEGYQAITTLAHTPLIQDTTILQMALVKRTPEALLLCDSFDSGIHTRDDALIGGLMGGLVGILGGPVGMLLMGTYGAFVGHMVDNRDALSSASLLEMVAEKLCEGEIALIALVDESNEAVLDERLSRFKTVIARFDAAVVADEVEEAQRIQKEMERETRQQLRASKKEERKQRIEVKRAKLKADFEAFKAKFKKNKAE